MRYNQKWYNKHFQEILGITNWDIYENISCVAKYQKSFSMEGQRYCKLCVRDVEYQNHSLGLAKGIFLFKFWLYLGYNKDRYNKNYGSISKTGITNSFKNPIV